ncbi:MAG: hypothetical protein SOW79_09385, partial [Prevotella sp.]|nr:hypothetical protein [Prevotella sp.]
VYFFVLFCIFYLFILIVLLHVLGLSYCKGSTETPMYFCSKPHWVILPDYCQSMLRSLSYAKEVQGERNGACSALPSRSLSYAKEVQGERNGACSALLSRSLSYAKLRHLFETWHPPACFLCFFM